MDGFLPTLVSCSSSSSELEIDLQTEPTNVNIYNARRLYTKTLRDDSTQELQIQIDRTSSAQCLNTTKCSSFSTQESQINMDGTLAAQCLNTQIHNNNFTQGSEINTDGIFCENQDESLTEINTDNLTLLNENELFIDCCSDVSEAPTMSNVSVSECPFQESVSSYHTHAGLSSFCQPLNC